MTTATPTEPKLLKPKELAGILNVSYQTVMRMLRRCEIKSVQIGTSPRSRRIPVTEVDAWIERKLVQSQDHRRKLMDRRRSF